MTVKLPAFLASALVNGDESGLTCSCGAMPENAGGKDRLRKVTHTGQCDFYWLAAALAYVAPGRIVDAEGEPSFGNTCNLVAWHLGADMLDYVVLYPPDGESQ